MTTNITGSHPAAAGNGSVFASKPDQRQKSIIGGQRRKELEQEVAELRKVLKNEEKVHEVLARALLWRDGTSPLHIPSFLPKRTKELLAELVVVEEEIARLENEISKIHKCSSQLQDVQDVKQTISTSSITQEKPSKSNSHALEEKVALMETKPLFFINQAIRGDYLIHGFTTKGKKENVTDNNVSTKKENRKVSGLSEVIPKRSGAIEKQSSPKPPHHSSSPRRSDVNAETMLKFLKEPSKSVTQNGQKLQPNKLSEKIMKCLLCIFLRLIRTSRVSEIEKSGNLLRSSNSFSRLKSFRFEGGLNLNSSLVGQKEMAQLDPYGIFKNEDSLVRDIGPYKNLVRCTSSSLDVRSISSSLQLLNKLRGLLDNLHEVDLRFLTHHQKLAFWINIYNTCIMHGFLQQGLPSSPEKITALKNKAVLDIGGNKLNALAIEHFILRQPSDKEPSWKGDKDDRENTVRSIYGLDQSEPNITFALCCGSKSSPSVRIYTADGVSAELEKSKLEFLQASIAVTATKRVMIPKLLVANMHDFAADLGSLVEWICNQLPASGSLRKSMAECLKGQSSSREPSDIVDIIPYDFEFQYLLPM